MNRKTFSLAVLLAFACAGASQAIPGIPDHVRAATLIVPFFETGINSTTNPNDTLMVVQNFLASPYIIHWHYWDIDGHATTLYGNYTLNSGASWSASSRDLLTAGPAAARTALTVGSFYKGFVTIDVVTAATALNPTQAGYPFSNINTIEGFIYYTRLSQGSANGLAMLPIEYVAPGANGLLKGFYRTNDSREEIDLDSRVCADQLARGVACTGDDNDKFYRVHLRMFGSAALSGTSRQILFTWTTGKVGGPSTLCVTAGCATSYQYRRYNEAGTVLFTGTQTLPHVVNDFGVFSPAESGFSSFWDVPSVGANTQFFAFTFNSAAPSGNPNLTWDAIFEAYITP